MTQRAPARIAVLMLGVIITWGAAFTAIKVVLREVGPGGLSFGRIFIAAVSYSLMLPFVRAPRPAPEPGDRWRLVVVGLTSASTYHLALNWGEQHVSAGVASLIVAAMPAMVAVGAAMVLREPLGIAKASGVGIAFAGVTLLVIAGGGEFEVDRLTGAVVTLGAPIVWAIYTIVSKPLSARYDGVRINLYGGWIGAVVLFPFGVRELDDLWSMSGEAWAWLVFLGTLSTAAAFVVYSYALRHLTASAVAAFVYLVPLFSIAWAWVLIEEVPSAWALVGGALIIVGVVAVQRSAVVLRHPEASPPSGLTARGGPSHPGSRSRRPG